MHSGYFEGYMDGVYLLNLVGYLRPLDSSTNYIILLRNIPVFLHWDSCGLINGHI